MTMTNSIATVATYGCDRCGRVDDDDGGDSSSRELLGAARDEFLRVVIRWRAEREEAERRLRSVEHELGLALAELLHQLPGLRSQA